MFGNIAFIASFSLNMYVSFIYVQFKFDSKTAFMSKIIGTEIIKPSISLPWPGCYS